MTPHLRVTTRNARFQLWQALLTNRNQRQRQGRFLVQGVRPINAALAGGWEVDELLYADGPPLSRWATATVTGATGTVCAVAPELMAELGDKSDGSPEVLAVLRTPEDRLDRIPVGGHDGRAPLVVLLDRPGSPGNLGTIVRSADALGAAGVVVTGHAADVYDPKAVRAGRGSLFGVPVVRSASFAEALTWVAECRAAGTAFRVVGTDEGGEVDVAEADLTGPTVLVVGNETTGMSAGARAACDVLVRIPMEGSASSLNAGAAATVVLYEAMRQRRAAGGQR